MWRIDVTAQCTGWWPAPSPQDNVNVEEAFITATRLALQNKPADAMAMQPRIDMGAPGQAPAAKPQCCS